MFKRLVLMAGIMGMGAMAYAGKPLIAEAPIDTYGTPATISISSFTLTKIPTTQTAGRTGVFVDVPNTNTGYIVGFYGDCTSTALANTIRPIEINPDSNSSFLPMSDDVCAWVINTSGTGSENIHVQNITQ